MNSASRQIGATRPKVIALRCSGGGASQFDVLRERLGADFDVHVPDYYGLEGRGPWIGAHPFTLADEAARSIALIDACDADIHLMGHSYGGGVAMHVALARPRRVRTLTLYEPSAFHLLLQMGGEGTDAYAEIATVVEAVHEGVLTGDYQAAVRHFVDYWNGTGAWNAMRESTRSALIALAPKLPLDFRALIEEPTAFQKYLDLDMPVHVLRGEHAPRPTRLIADLLAQTLTRCRRTMIAGAGHMGPVTHAGEVAGAMAEQIITSHRQPDTTRSNTQPEVSGTGPVRGI